MHHRSVFSSVSLPVFLYIASPSKIEDEPYEYVSNVHLKVTVHDMMRHYRRRSQLTYTWSTYCGSMACKFPILSHFIMIWRIYVARISILVYRNRFVLCQFSLCFHLVLKFNSDAFCLQINKVKLASASHFRCIHRMHK